MTANPWGNVPDDFVIPVPTAARLLKVTEQDLYAGVLNGLYVLLAPNDRWGEVIPLLDEGDPIVGPPPEVLRAYGHWLLSGTPKKLYQRPPWRDVGRSDLMQWLRDGTLPVEFGLYDDGRDAPPCVVGHFPLERHPPSP